LYSLPLIKNTSELSMHKGSTFLSNCKLQSPCQWSHLKDEVTLGETVPVIYVEVMLEICLAAMITLLYALRRSSAKGDLNRGISLHIKPRKPFL